MGGVETFNGMVGIATTFSTDFGIGGAITGTYTGFDNFHGPTFHLRHAGRSTAALAAATMDTYGSYSLSLSSTLNPDGVTYFGLYLSAIDFGNIIQLYDGDSLVEDLELRLHRPALFANPAYLGDQFSEPSPSSTSTPPAARPSTRWR